MIAPPVYNDANFRKQFPQFANPTSYPPSALQFAWDMGGNWVNQNQPTVGPPVPVTGESVGTGAVSTATFAHTAASLPVIPGSVVIAAGSVVATDDGAGNLTGTGVTAGTINYTTGVLSITYAVDPAVGLPITLSYSYTSPPCNPPLCGLWAAPWCTGLSMRPAQLQQAADLMGAVICYQLYGPASGGITTASQEGEAPGAVTSATEGSISATFQLPEIGSSAFKSMLLASPPYGRMLFALLQIAASVGAYIPSGRPAWIPP